MQNNEKDTEKHPLYETFFNIFSKEDLNLPLERQINNFEEELEKLFLKYLNCDSIENGMFPKSGNI